MGDLLERDCALHALCAALVDASRGHGSVALVTGEPGIGKSALVTSFTARHTGGARVLVGMCDDLATPRPLGPFQDVADELPEPLAGFLRRGADPRTVHTLLLEELRSGGAPTVLVLEDVHWADQATVDAITVLGRRIAGMPALLVLTYRIGEVGPDHPLRTTLDAMQHTTSQHLELAPLSREAVGTMAGEDVDRVYDVTGGNPFFVTELLSQGDGPPPPSLANAVLGRVARLDRSSRELLEVISMVPARVPTDVLDIVEPTWPAAAELAERRQLLTIDAQYVRFRHELTRAAIRSSVPAGRRRVLHRRILRALQAVGADPADLVHHAEAAGETEVVAENALVAAHQARVAGSNREAFAHFQRARAFIDRLDPGGRAGLWEDLARSALLVGRMQAALDAAGRAIAVNEQLGRDDAAVRCRSFRAHLHWCTGDGAAARQEATGARRAARGSASSTDRAGAYVRSSEFAMLTSRPTECFRWGREGLRLGGSDDGTRTLALAVLGGMRLQLDPDDTGPMQEALEEAHAAHEYYHALLVRTAFAFLNLLWVRPRAAQGHGEVGYQDARAHEVDGMAEYLEAILAWGRLRAGVREDAARLAGTRAVARTEGAVTALQGRTVLAELAVRRGDSDAAELLGTLAEDVDRTGELKRIQPVLELQVEHALTSGTPLPVQRFEQVKQIVGPEPLQVGCLGGRFAAWATLCGLPHTFSGRPPEPHAAMLAGQWSAAADAFGSVGWAHDRALMLSMVESRDALLEAVSIARAQNAGPLERRATQRLHEIGVAPPRGPTATTRSNPAQLTDRQLEVLSLLREGETNAAIGARLHVSPRTVEHHVSTILTKLGVASRAQAVARSSDLRVP